MSAHLPYLSVPHISTRSVLSLFGLLIVGVFAPSIASGQVAAPVPPNLADDVRLQRATDVNVTGIPLDELLAKLSNGNLRLVAGRSCAAQKVQIRLKQRPLLNLLQALAQLLPGAWDALPDNSGYRLNMDSRALKRRDDWWRLYQSEREQALADQRAYLLGVLRNGEVAPTERYNVNPEYDAHVAAGNNFFCSLPAPLQDRLATRMNETAFFGLQGFGFGTGDDEGAVVVALSELPETTQTLVRQQVSRQVAGVTNVPSWQDVTIKLANGGLGFQACIDLPNGPSLGTSFSAIATADLNRYALILDHTFLSVLTHKQGARAPQGWKLLTAYQDSRVWQNDKPATPRASTNKPRRAERLKWLGDNADMEFVADYYSLGGSPTQLPPAPIAAQDVKTELDQAAVEQDMSWMRQPDSIYLFRDNRWYRDDHLEVSAPLLRRWLALSLPYPQESQPALASANAAEVPPQTRMQKWMDRAAEFASALTPWQISTGLRYYAPAEDEEAQKIMDASLRRMMHYTGLPPGRTYGGEGYPFWNDAITILHRYNTIRFYAGLSEDARTAALKNTLRYDSLSTMAQEQAQFLLPDLQTLLLRGVRQPIILGMQPNIQSAVPDAGPVMGRVFIVSPAINRTNAQ